MSTVGRIVQGARDLTVVVKDAGRFAEITRALAKYGYGWTVARLGLGGEAEPEAGEEASEALRLPRGRRIRMLVEELGPTFIKLGQILSTRPDLVPPDILAELQGLQDDTPEMPLEEVEEMIRSELGKGVDDLFEFFERTPLASASMAQVHRARTHSGEEVVVKVQRPRLAERFDADLNILTRIAARAPNVFPELELMDPLGIVVEFDRALRKELDFVNERRNIARFRVNFAGFEGLRAPRTYDTLSTSRVLTMEFVDGVKITLAPERHGLDPYVVGPRMLRALFKMVFQDGFFHGDLHPGNILVMPDGEIVLIDFGLVGRLTEAQKNHIMDILIGLSRQDYQLVSRVYYELGIKLPGVVYDYDAFEADVTEVMERHVADRTLSEIDVGAIFRDLVEGAIRHRIKMPPTYTMVFKALMTIEGIGKTLAPDINFIAEAEPFVREVLIERYSPKRLLRESSELVGGVSRFLRMFPSAATELLLSAERGRLAFRVIPDGLDRHIEAHNREQRLATRTMGFGACMIAGSLALDVEMVTLLSMPWISVMLYCTGILFGAPLLIGLIRRSG
jgi:ubiquinone biosynthesis protein